MFSHFVFSRKLFQFIIVNILALWILSYLCSCLCLWIALKRLLNIRHLWILSEVFTGAVTILEIQNYPQWLISLSVSLYIHVLLRCKYASTRVVVHYLLVLMENPKTNMRNYISFLKETITRILQEIRRNSMVLRKKTLF